MKLQNIFLSVLLLLSAVYELNARQIKGTVKDGQGNPVNQVVVSDGYNTAITDEKGRYTLNTSDNGRFVFISTPSGYLSSARETDNNDCFYIKLADGRSKYDFIVKKNTLDDRNHQAIVIADPQVLDMEDIGLLEERIDKMLPDIKESSHEYTFGICLGDIVGYDHSLYPAYMQKIDKSGIDFRHAPGNHDMTRDNVRSHEGSMTRYEDFFGPSWYSFNVGEVHYVVLNNNFYIGRQWYYIGYIDENQFSWLEKDLSHVDHSKKVVVCMHIPTTLSEKDRQSFSYYSLAEIQANKEPLYDILAPYEAIILSGHMHTCNTQDISDKLVEINVGGLCGAWWCGDVCTDGGPAGYKEMTFNGTGAKWRYVGCGMPKDYQMKIYTDLPEHGNQVFANIWDYDEKWKVEYFENGVKKCDMTRIKMKDPHAAEIFREPSKYKISWVGASESQNFFKAVISPDAEKAHIKVTDRFGREYIEEILLSSEEN